MRSASLELSAHFNTLNRFKSIAKHSAKKIIIDHPRLCQFKEGKGNVWLIFDHKIRRKKIRYDVLHEENEAYFIIFFIKNFCIVAKNIS